MKREDRTLEKLRKNRCSNLSHHIKTPLVYHDDNDIQYVPDAVKVGEPVNTQLQDLLYHIIEDENAEDYFAAEDEIIPCSDVSN